MRLFEAILDANHRAVSGDKTAGLHPADFADSLPLVALTCIDVRLNSILPQVLGVLPERFIWLRNAGNVITGPQSSTMRSLSLACAVKGGKEIAIIGHTDCQVGKTTTLQLLERLRAIGVERHMLPDNLTEFFGMFGSDRQNVIKAADIARQSPLIGPKIPVHGLLVDIETGKLDWLVNGYEVWQRQAPPVKNNFASSTSASTEELGAGAMAGFHFREIKFPEAKIGEASVKIGEPVPPSQAVPPASSPPISSARPPKIPLPPPIRP